MSSVNKPNTETILALAHRPVFPFFSIKFEKAGKNEPPVKLNVKVDDEIYEFIYRTFGTDEIIFSLDSLSSQISAWTPSMHNSINSLQEMELFSSTNKWLQESRKFLRKQAILAKGTETKDVSPS